MNLNDYYLFGNMKKDRQASHFSDEEEAKIAVWIYFENKPKEAILRFFKSIELSLKWHHKLIEISRDYNEK